MKILLLSDTHGDVLRIDQVLNLCGRPDLVIHCGDVERDCDYIEKMLPANVPFLAVCGNNDLYAGRPYQIDCAIGGLRFYITHGHRQRVKNGTEGLIRAAKEKDCQIALHGHTHRPMDQIVDGIRIINPGALAYPINSYAILHIENSIVDVRFLNL